jgi:hypothetical protein
MKVIHIVGVDWESVLCVCDENSSFTDLFAWHDEDTFKINGKSIPRQKHAVGFAGESSSKRTKKVRWPKSNQLRWNIGLLTGCCQHEDHILKL